MDESYTKFPNKLLESMIAYSFTRRQYAILLYIVRNTHGWGKPYGDKISIAWIADATGIGKKHVNDTVLDLEKMGVLNIERRDGAPSCIGINGPSEWDQPTPKRGVTPKRGATPEKGGGGTPKRGGGTTPQKRGYTKERIKDTSSKERNNVPTFSEDIENRVRAMHPGMSDEELVERGWL